MAKYYGCCLTRHKGGRKCVGRRMLTKPPAEYVLQPKCPHCGARRWYVDKQIAKRHRREVCYCSGYHHPHRKGSKYCNENPEAEKNWEERLAGVEILPEGAWPEGRE